jgi:hypothetical protein
MIAGVIENRAFGVHVHYGQFLDQAGFRIYDIKAISARRSGVPEHFA